MIGRVSRSILCGFIFVLLLTSFSSNNSKPPNVSAHDVFAPVLSFGGPGFIDGALDDPIGIELYNNEIYVVDRNNNRIQVFDTDGQFVRKIGTSGSGNGGLNFPTKIALDDSNIYVTDTGNGLVQVFNHAGIFQTQFGNPNKRINLFSSPTGIVHNGSNILVLDSIDNEVLIYDLNLNYQASFGGFGSAAGEFDGPNGITHNGTHILVADTENDRIQIFTSDGSYVSQFGSYGSGQGQFSTPDDVRIIKNRIFVADTLINRIQIFDLSGNFISTFGVSETVYYSTFVNSGMGGSTFTYTNENGYLGLKYPKGIVSSDTHLFISDSGNDRIKVFSYHFHDDVVFNTETITTNPCECSQSNVDSTQLVYETNTKQVTSTLFYRSTTTEVNRKSEAGDVSFAIFTLLSVVTLVMIRRFKSI